MKQKGAVFLQIVVMLIGIGALAFLLWEPHIEGRNVNATLFEIYFKDPFLLYACTASISFFVILYQAFKLLGNIRKNEIFSKTSVKALQTIKCCGIILIGFLVGAEAYLFIVQRSNDDIAGGVFMGLLIIFASSIIAAAADVFEGVLQSAIDTKSKKA